MQAQSHAIVPHVKEKLSTKDRLSDPGPASFDRKYLSLRFLILPFLSSILQLQREDK